MDPTKMHGETKGGAIILSIICMIAGAICLANASGSGTFMQRWGWILLVFGIIHFFVALAK